MSYQDYIFKNGKYIGEFEKMYENVEDPWDQSTREENSTDKKIILNAVEQIKPKRILDIGCGHGHFTNKLQLITQEDVLGIDIAPAAINKAKKLYNNCDFKTSDILNFELIDNFMPDLIVMAEVSWYILEKLKQFNLHLKNNHKDTILIHTLSTYKKGQQKHGVEYFTDLNGILKFFEMSYLEYGQINRPLHGEGTRTYFIGKHSTFNNSFNL